MEGDTVSLNLAPFIETVKQRLVEGGFGLAARIPEVNASFVLFDVKNLTRARSAFNLLNTLGIWLPIITIVLLGIGVFVAKDHRRALVGAAVGVAVAMVALGLALAVFRTIYLNAVPAAVLPHDAAAVLYDTIVAYLRLGLRTVLVLALVVAAGAFLTGQSVTAVRTRQGSPTGWAGCAAAPNTPGSAPARWGPGCTPTRRSCASPPSPWPRWRWCSGASRPARPSCCWPGCC